jgi:hypothetical protein
MLRAFAIAVSSAASPSRLAREPRCGRSVMDTTG